MNTTKNNEVKSQLSAQHVNCFRCEYLFIIHEKNKRMGAKNLGLRGLIFPQLRYFQQLARNVLISH